MDVIEESVQKMAERFENQVIECLKKLGFKDINGGRNFRIGDIQVDACGGHEDTLLVIECLVSSKKAIKSVRQKIQIFRGNIPILSKAFHKHETYGKYLKNKYILAVKNINLNEEDKNFAEEKPQVYIWDEQLLSYYTALSTLIGTHARYNLLGEIGVEPRVENVISIPAFQTRLENYTLYLFFIEPQKLIQASYVARREVGREKYYQRFLNKDRIGKIQRFIQKGGLFPNNIIVAFNSPPKFVPFNEVNSQVVFPNWLKFGILNFPSNYRSCWIIDGQHRLYSFPEPSGGDKIAVAAFEKIKPERQAQFFIEINREQKPVEADLLWDLEGEMRPESEEGIISNIVKRLNEISPLEDKIYVPLQGRGTKGQLKFSGLCLSIQKRRLVKEVTETMEGAQKNPMHNTNHERIVEYASKSLASFFQQIDKQFNDSEKDEFAFTNGGISVMVTVFERILSRVNKIPSSDDIEKYVKALHDVISSQYPNKIDRKNLRLRITSEGGKTELTRSLCLSIRELTGDKQFGGQIPTQDFETRVVQFERRFAKFVFGILGISSLAELQHCAPPDVYGKTKKREAAQSEKGIIGEVSEHLTLGECSQMLKYGNNWDKLKIFLIETQSGFGSEAELQAAIQAVTGFRVSLFHGKTMSSKYRERDLINIYLDKLEKCVEEYESGA
ncbi:MAG: DGQHR domain-containing protein [Planctomycetes bacterium]|nr:DGQHR domain-containing protein [Planctomycetota bacterium]